MKVNEQYQDEYPDAYYCQNFHKNVKLSLKNLKVLHDTKENFYGSHVTNKIVVSCECGSKHTFQEVLS